MAMKIDLTKRIFLAGAAATALALTPIGVTTALAEPAPPPCVDVNVPGCATAGPGGAQATVPGAGAVAGPDGAAATVPGADAVAGPDGAAATVPGADAVAGPGGAAATVPGAGASAGPEGAAANVPGADANVGPGGGQFCVENVGCVSAVG
jgi:hypothetical protein